MAQASCTYDGGPIDVHCVSAPGTWPKTFRANFKLRLNMNGAPEFTKICSVEVSITDKTSCKKLFDDILDAIKKHEVV